MTIIPITTDLQARQFHFGRFCLQVKFNEAAQPKVDLLVHTAPHTTSVVTKIPMGFIAESYFKVKSLWNIHPIMAVPNKARHDPGLAIDLISDGEIILSTWVEPSVATQHVLSEAKRMFIW